MRGGAARLVAVALCGLMIVVTGPARALPGGNRLGSEASPYLQLHASDPVHWRTWSEASLKEAAELGRPILLSIGYAACHWCHVMQKESFADPATAAIINRLYVPILIDREERPDLDSAFQAQALHLDLPTGWPLTLFLTPEARPFYGGTYFPAEARGGYAPFKEFLVKISEVYAEDADAIRMEARQWARAFEHLNRPRPGDITAAHQEKAAAALLAEIDGLAGGFGEAPKHPHWVALWLLWRTHIATGRAEAGDAVLTSLRHMAEGGVYDHVGGGFFRYAVDPLWRTPHFEKMIDVNAGLLRLMTEVWRETRDPVLENAVRGTVGFLLGELRLPGGAFASSLDADSEAAGGEREEGAFYVWSRNELERALGTGAPAFLDAFGLAPIEGADIDDDDDRGVLHRLSDAAETDSLARLAGLRGARPRPPRDDKVLADGNGMAIRGLAEAAMAFGEKTWLEAAVAAFTAVRSALEDSSGRPAQSAVGSRRGPAAGLDGLAALAAAALTLFEATGEEDYLARARAWSELAIRHHGDGDTPGFFAAADDAGAVVMPVKPFFDNPNPSGNARMIELFARLYYLTGENRWRQRAAATAAAFGAAVETPALGLAGLLNAAHVLEEAIQVVVIGRRGEAGTDHLLGGVMRRSVPGQVLEIVAPGTVLPEGHPARYKTQIDGRATAYVCRGTVCSLPAVERSELDETLVLMRKRSG